MRFPNWIEEILTWFWKIFLASIYIIWLINYKLYFFSKKDHVRLSMDCSNSGNTMFSNNVLSLSSLIFDWRVKKRILLYLVILESATYKCPWVNGGCVVSKSMSLYCCPWDLFMLIAYANLVKYLKLNNIILLLLLLLYIEVVQQHIFF